MNNNRRRRRSSTINTDVTHKKVPKFWKIIWVLVGLLAFMAITSFTGFYAPDFYMLVIFGFIIIVLNIYLVYTLVKEKINESR